MGRRGAPTSVLDYQLHARPPIYSTATVISAGAASSSPGSEKVPRGARQRRALLRSMPASLAIALRPRLRRVLMASVEILSLMKQLPSGYLSSGGASADGQRGG